MWKDHRICSVLLQRKESWTSGWEVSREKKNAAQYKEHLAGLFQQREFDCELEDNTES